MKKWKNIISLNSAKAEFNNEMNLEEKFQALTNTHLQKVKGGSCSLYDSSSSESPSCSADRDPCIMDGCVNCIDLPNECLDWWCGFDQENCSSNT